MNNNGQLRLRPLTHDPIVVNKFEALLQRADNYLTQRKLWLQDRNRPDRRRDLADECGYPDLGRLDAWFFEEMYQREPVAARVVEIMPKESWQVTPEVYEVERGQVQTPFEQGWDELGRGIRPSGVPCYWGEEKGSPIWETLIRADIESRKGHYGTILIGGLGVNRPGDFMTPAPGVIEDGSATYEHDNTDAPRLMVAQDGRIKPTGWKPEGRRVLMVRNSRQPRPMAHNVSTGGWPVYNLTTDPESQTDTAKTGGVKFLRVHGEHLARVTRWESNPRSPRYGWPVTYQLTFIDSSVSHVGSNVPMSTLNVHWSRVVHIADTNHTSCQHEALAVPAMRPVMHPLCDIAKIAGASAEGFWQAAFPYLFFSTHPQLGGDVDVDQDEMEDLYERLINGGQRSATLKGMSGQLQAPSTPDPTNHMNVQIERICVKLGVPKRVFVGSERGELASSQDDAAWNDRLKQRQNGYISPRIVARFVDHMIMVGALPVPKAIPAAKKMDLRQAEDGKRVPAQLMRPGYKIWWPDLTSQTDGEKAQVLASRTQAWAAYSSSQMPSMVPPFEYATRFDRMTEEEATAMLGEAVDEIEAPEESDFGLEDLGIEPATPGGGGQPAPDQEPPAGNEFDVTLENASFFESCPRDDRGRCTTDGGSVSVEKTKKVAQEKAAAVKDEAQGEVKKVEKKTKGKHGKTDPDVGPGVARTFTPEEQSIGLSKLKELPAATPEYTTFDVGKEEVRMTEFGMTKGRIYGGMPDISTPAGAKKYVTKTVDPSQVRYAQSSVIRDAVAEKVEGKTGDAFRSENLPTAVEEDGVIYLQTGHHRSAAEVVSTGKVTVKVTAILGRRPNGAAVYGRPATNMEAGDADQDQE